MLENIDANFSEELIFCLEIIFAVILGGIIGIEREITNKFAGLRTHILVATGACVFTILSIHAFPNVLTDNPQYLGDPARIAAQIVTGIGFIGGGTVLRHGANIFGLTTAATLWMAASVGMACGAGFFGIAFFASVLSLVVLVLIRSLEIKLIPNCIKKARKIKLLIFLEEENLENFQKILPTLFDDIYEISTSNSSREDDFVKMTIKLNINSPSPVKDVYNKILNQPSIKSSSVSEIYE